MFYKQIEHKRNEWYDSADCTVKDLIHYIEQHGQMRDAQIEAIKTFLFLKIACQNKPLWQLFNKHPYLQVQRPKIMSPLGYAMGFIHYHEIRRIR